MVSCAVQNLLSLIKFHVFIFVFIFIILGGGSKKFLLQFMLKSVLPTFSSKSFVVSSLTFSSFICYEFILGMVLWSVLISYFTHSCPVFSVPLIEKPVISPCVFFPPLS